MLAQFDRKTPVIKGNGFRYTQREPETNEVVFEGDLHTMRCEGINKNGGQCRRSVTIGLKKCFQHRNGLKVADSGLEHAGKGLWVRSKRHGENEIVYRKDDIITRYNGEIISEEEVARRYGVLTAPYAVELRNGNVEDASLFRGLGSLINHKPARETNCILYQGRGRNYIVIKAKKNIRNNTELFLSYGREYRFDDNINTTKYVRPQH